MPLRGRHFRTGDAATWEAFPRLVEVAADPMRRCLEVEANPDMDAIYASMRRWGYRFCEIQRPGDLSPIFPSVDISGKYGRLVTPRTNRRPV